MSISEGYCPNTYRIPSIIATVLFFPIGLFGIHYGKKTFKYYRHPDKYNLSVKCSQRARTFSSLGIIFGIAFWVSLYIIFFL
ncbi:MAG: CD225/dispanin family protein [Bacteroidales bacterium]|nr:CD225/dispanin family protein [Bacteroidales bacterium]